MTTHLYARTQAIYPYPTALSCCLAALPLVSWCLLSPIPTWHQYNTYAPRTRISQRHHEPHPQPPPRTYPSPRLTSLTVAGHSSAPLVSIISCMVVGILRASSAYFRTMTMSVVEVGEIPSLPLTRPQQPVQIDHRQPQTTTDRQSAQSPTRGT